jgi:DNA-binding transcriptional regulator YhcF (GntR family)
MEYVFDNDRPIYLQLVEQLRLEIISGKLKMGEKIPSVRDFAMQVKVNPNTMQKALAELEREKLIYTERTNGKYITNDEEVIKNLKKSIIDEKIDNFILDMQKMGISQKEVFAYLQKRKG